MANPKKKPVKKALPYAQIFLGAAIVLVAVLIAAIFTSRNIREDKTVLVSCSQELILLRHYMYFLNMMKYDYENEWTNSYGASATDIAEIWNTVEDGLSYADLLKNMALEQAQQLFAEYHLAKQNGFAPTPEVVRESNANIDQIISTVFTGTNTPNTDFYNAYGLTVNEMKELEVYIKLAGEWRAGVIERTVVTDEQALAYFTENPDLFERVTTRHILIGTQDLETEEEIAAAEDLANDLLRRINEGEPIGSLVAEYTDDTYSIETDGEYEFGRGEMVPEFEDWAFSAGVGDTAVVETDFGFHVMQLMHAPFGFNELREMIKDAMKEEESQTTISEAITNANLEWKLNDAAFKKVKF